MGRFALIKTLRENPVIIAFYLPELLISFSTGVLVANLPLYAAQLGADYGLVGLFIGAAALGQILGDLPSGIILSRWGTKRVMLTGIAVMALAMLALSFTTDIYQATACRFVSGLGAAMMVISRHHYLTYQMDVERRGRSSGMMGGVLRIGRFIGPLVGGTVALHYGLRGAFVLCFIAYTLSLLIILVKLKVQREVGGAPVQGLKHTLGPLWQTLRNNYRVLSVAGLGLIFAQIIRSGRDIVVPLYASDILGLDVQAVNLIVSIAAGAEMLMFYPAGVIMDRFGRKYAIVPPFVSMGLCVMMVPLASSALGLLLVTSLMGISNGLSSGTMIALGSDLAPRDGHQGEFLGVWGLIGDIGATGGPMMAGGIAEALTLGLAALVIGGAGIMAGVVFGRFVPETRHKHLKAA
jgi:MFS family permease